MLYNFEWVKNEQTDILNDHVNNRIIFRQQKNNICICIAFPKLEKGSFNVIFFESGNANL